MAEYFLDSSALVKRYVRETGSGWIHSLFTITREVPRDVPQDHEIFVAGIAGVEMVSAITRRARGGSIAAADALTTCAQIRTDLATQYQVIQVTERLLSRAMRLAERYALRGYDAVQLAAGCELNSLCLASGLPVLTFVSADRELNRAAEREGLKTEDPNMHG